jgi:hypothetical protein
VGDDVARLGYLYGVRRAIRVELVGQALGAWDPVSRSTLFISSQNQPCDQQLGFAEKIDAACPVPDARSVASQVPF